MNPKFQVGDAVKTVSFTDCFGVFHPVRDGLRVTDVRQMPGCPAHGTNKALPPYYRYMVCDAHGFAAVEAAERYFAAV